MTRKTAFDQWVQDAKAQGAGDHIGTAPPPCPSDLDVASLEQAFVSSLQAVDDVYLACLLGVCVSDLRERLDATVNSLLDVTPSDSPPTLDTASERSVDERNPAAADLSVLQVVTLLHQQATTSTSRVLVLLRQCIEILPDYDSTLLPTPHTTVQQVFLCTIECSFLSCVEPRLLTPVYLFIVDGE